jgi:hypothetical protein
MGAFDLNKSYIVPTVFAPSDVGMFAIYPPDNEDYFTSHFDTCREQFAKKFDVASHGFFLSMEMNNLDSVPRFIRMCEGLLELDEITSYYLTDMQYIIFIRPASFWKSCYMRRSLFTLLCRLGMYFFDDKKFENHLFGKCEQTKKEKVNNSYAFAAKTEKAITRFFGGHHSYIGDGPDMDHSFPEKHGWVIEFAGKKDEYIKKVLVKNYEEGQPVFFGRNLFLT